MNIMFWVLALLFQIGLVALFFLFRLSGGKNGSKKRGSGSV